MVNQTRIAINFDLSVKECKTVFGGSRSKAYNVLKKDLTGHGFIHDQGSGYVSDKSMTRAEILSSLVSLTNRQPWIIQCCKKLRVTAIAEDLFSGNVHGDLIRALGDLSTSETPKKPQKRIRSKLETEANRQFTERRQAQIAEVEAMDISPERKAELLRGIDEIYSRKPPTMAEVKAELRGKNPREIAEMTQSSKQKSTPSGKNSSEKPFSR